MTTNNFISMVGVLLSAAVLTLLHDVLGSTASRILVAAGAFTLIATIGAIALMPASSMALLLPTALHPVFRNRIARLVSTGPLTTLDADGTTVGEPSRVSIVPEVTAGESP